LKFAYLWKAGPIAKLSGLLAERFLVINGITAVMLATENHRLQL
jgi:hypothetical protein